MNMSLGAAECEAFSEKFLADTALEELKGLGWIEKETAAVRKLVEQTVSLFLSDRDLARATTPIEQLKCSCNARRKGLNNQSELNKKNLEAVGVNKPETESLPKALYPLVYLKMLDAANFDVYSVIKDSFLEFAAGDSKKNKIKFIRIIERRLVATKMFKEVAENLLESLKVLMTSFDGRTRLGKFIFKENAIAMKDWERYFTERSKPELRTIPGEVETFAAGLIEDFLKVRYFAGNPCTAPGVLGKFKKMIASYVGEAELSRLNIGSSNVAFTVRLNGETKVDRAKLSAFLEAVQKAWLEKFSTGEALIIEQNILADGSAERGQLFI